MEVLKPFGRHDEIRDWRDYMSLNLCLLTGEALAGPFANILLEVCPDELVCYGFSGAFDTRVAKAMDDVKQSSTI